MGTFFETQCSFQTVYSCYALLLGGRDGRRGMVAEGRAGGRKRKRRRDMERKERGREGGP